MIKSNPDVYVIMGIDTDENDQVIAVCRCYEDAKKYCAKWLMETAYLDVWMEKHPIQ